MEETYRIEYTKEPEWGVIGPAIHNYNIEQAGEDSAERLCFVLRAAGDEVVGGVIGITFWNWLHIDLMWLHEDLRGRGYGSRLLAAAEQEARQRGARHAELDTLSFQAPGFYLKHGYRVFGELEDYPEGHSRYYMTKEL